MKQLVLDSKSGAVEVVELPEPALRAGTLLVRNACSVISPGTERSALQMARDSYVATARARPDLVRRVLDTVRREGVLAAYRKVQARLGELTPLGYSSAGTVVAVDSRVLDGIQVGERVCCAGAGQASHAQVVCVPTNLTARIPEGVSFEAAAFATLGAIALHGVRQAAPTLGERFAVIGLGVMGLLTVQILRAAGVRVIAFDLSPELTGKALALGAEAGANGAIDEQVHAAFAWTDGLGVDGVVVTAAASGDAPMVAAAGMCRDRARVTAVGLVPFTLPREIAYQKELELRISRSYGPGRYDSGFEEKGMDYPIGYVRWTETRNLEAFLHLVAEGRVTPLELVTHRFSVEEAPKAYDHLLSDEPPRPLGMLITYPGDGTERAAMVEARVPQSGSSSRRSGPRAAEYEAIGVGLIGAGSFARSVLLPLLKQESGIHLRSVVTAHGLSALDAQRRFGFESIGTDPEQLLSDPAIHLVFIATRHDSHAELVARALRAGKHVFVEKPLALNEPQLVVVEEALASAPGMLMVGFNRRFSPYAIAIRDAFERNGPFMMNYRVNANPLPPGHWLDDPDIGGGRIVGEVCHFVDLMFYLAGDPDLVSVRATGARPSRTANGEVLAQLSFSSGSSGSLLYTVGGSPLLGKEYLEVHGSGISAVNEDFKKCTIYKGRKRIRPARGGKGHAEEISRWLGAVRKGLPPPVSPGVYSAVMRTTFRIQRALQQQLG
jgi:predicted dehydrogenase